MRRTFLAAGLALALTAPAIGYAAMNNTGDANIGDVKRLVEKGAYKEAAAKAEDVLGGDPRSADAYNYLGYSHRKLGNLDKARAAYDRALKIDPNHVGAHEYYGELQIELGNLPAAEKHLVELTRICGDCAERKELAGKIVEAKAGG